MNMMIDKITEDEQTKFTAETLEILRTTKEPRHAYVAIEIQKVRSERKDGKRFETRLGTGIHIVNVEEQPEQWYIINDSLMNRRGKIICWGRFPNASDPDPARAKKYRNHNNPENQTNSYDVLEGKLLSVTGKDDAVYAEMSEYKKKVQQLQAENEELKNGRSSKKDGATSGGKKAAGDQPSGSTNDSRATGGNGKSSRVSAKTDDRQTATQA